MIRWQPSAPGLVGLQFGQWGPRHRAQGDVVVGEVDDEAVEPVGDRRAGRAPSGVVRPEHEVVEQQLRVPVEQAGQRRRAVVGVEAVLLVDADPGQLLAALGQLVAAPCVRLLGLEQFQPGRKPLFPGSGFMAGHCFLLDRSCHRTRLGLAGPVW
jgi:hypothetical protein